MTTDVGARLKHVRQLQGLSQRELAKRVGVTNSTISLIEQNRVSPSVGSLKKLLDGLSISLADFFTSNEELPGGDRVFYTVEDQPNLGSGGIDYFLLGAGKPSRDMEILREVLPTGADTGEERIRHSGEEGGIVVQGRLELTVGEETQVLEPDEGYYFSGDIPHRFRSVGEDPLIIISANTSPRPRGNNGS